MKIEVAKRDLESALAVVSSTLGSGGGDITSHFVFRQHKGIVEVLASNRQIFSCTPLVAQVTSDDPAIRAFSIEAKRLRGAKGWLSAVGDEAIILEVKDGCVTGTSSRGSIKFPTLDPKEFPFWDDVLDTLNPVCSINPKRFRRVLEHASHFISSDDTNKPQYCVVEYHNGALFAAKKEAMSRISYPEIEGSHLRIHGKNVKPLVNFMSQFDDDLSLYESDRAFIVKSSTGASFGEMKFHANFPTNLGSWETGSPYFWKLRPEEIIGGIKFLIPGMDLSYERVLFIPTPSGVKLAVESATSGVEEITLELLDRSDPPYEGREFFVNYPTLVHILDQFKDEVVLGIHPLSGHMGYLRFHHEDEGVEYLNLVAWLKP